VLKPRSRSSAAVDSRIDRGEQRDERRELPCRVERQHQLCELRRRPLGLTTRKTQAFAADERFDHRHVPRPGAHERIAHCEFRRDVALRI
jgi:hypothetical protein